jgi:vacuolar protein sorting-associated protein 45
MERYPAFRSRSINVSKHVAIMGELARLTDKCQLLDISSLEQEISCANDHAEHKRLLFEKIASSRIQAADKLRLALVFAIRYESYDESKEIKARLVDAGFSGSETAVLDALLEYAGEAHRAPGLFSTGSIVSKLHKALKGSINGVENVYTQHQPLLSRTLEAIATGKLKDSAFPLVASSTSSRPSDVIVYIVGGVTFEEATKVAEFNAVNPALRIILGGSCIHNSTSFLREVSNAFGR